ncbi:uncharacterized protein TNIN_474161 [Trichonephila inaurata madagascariensis]|uniref:Uncharacterized protein n=2 Tax=Trichonephila TaxID=2585208 RepID=A0A8X7CE57_9ARAC|nr:uncharacterized protein TNIN_474161 [Trichonephila inaurata madagascariensis]
MSSGDEQSDEETVPLFRPFTKESLAAIEARIAELNARKAERERLKAEGEIGPDGVPEHYSIPHHEDRLEPDPGLEVGMPLPRALAPDFPPELIATPIEDLDKYYENERVSQTRRLHCLYEWSSIHCSISMSPIAETSVNKFLSY